jgi:hypothetical protein
MLTAASHDALNGLVGSEREKIQEDLLLKSMKFLFFKLPKEEVPTPLPPLKKGRRRKEGRWRKEGR